jgi:tRNA-dihydrouridine synthase 2
VTCKIRLLENREKTVDLLRMIEKTGVTAVAVHSRYIADRPRFPARWEELTETLKAAALSIPVIANGDVFLPQDVSRIGEVTEGLCTSVMIARGALDNPSVFLAASDSLHSGR